MGREDIIRDLEQVQVEVAVGGRLLDLLEDVKKGLEYVLPIHGAQEGA